MKSRNSYLGVDPIVVQCVKRRAWYAKRYRCLDHQSLDDIEQELLCSIWPSLNKYEKDKCSFATFVNQLTKRHLISMIRKHSCLKRGGKAGVTFIDPTILDNVVSKKCFSENETTTRIDVEDIISKLPKKWQIICEQLKVLNIVEVAKVNGLSRTTVYSILKKIKQRIQRSWK